MRLFIGLVMSLLIMGSSAGAFAQGAAGGLSGTIVDPNGTAVAGLNVPINMKNRATGQVYSAAIMRDGSYSITGLPAGEYDLNIPIECCMYRTYEQKAVSIAAGAPRKMDIKVDWGINLGTIGDDPGMVSNDLRAQTKNVNAPPPRTPDGKIDISGIWVNVPQAGQQPQPKMKKWALDIQQELRKQGQGEGGGPSAQGPAAFCLPQSATPTNLPFPYKFVQTPNLIIQITEQLTPAHRQIFLDGRKHTDPDEAVSGWYGESVAHWEGDTLVIVSQNFNEITPGYGIHSDKLKVTERITRPTRGKLIIDITAEDPEAWDAPLHRTIEAGLVESTEILEWVCAENNKDALHFGGLGWKGRP